MSSPDEIRALREAVAAVKGFLEDAGVGIPPNDLIITGVQDHGDLWLFTWNNAWPLLQQPRLAYPGCHPVVVFKEDGQLFELMKYYSWVAGSFEAALDEVRGRWRRSLELP